jgi:CHAT domain-containing protein
MKRSRRIRNALVTTLLFAGFTGPLEARAGTELRVHQQIQSRIDLGFYLEAEIAARALLESTEADSGPRSLQTARALDLLVEALGRQGEPLEAEAFELAERAVSIRKERQGPEHPEVSSSLSAARWYQALQGIRSLIDDYQFARAETAARVLLGETEAAEGPESLRAARALDLIGEAARRRGAPGAELLEVAERALAIREKRLGAEHPDVSRSLNLVGVAHSSASDFENAQKVLDRAVAIAERAFGPEDVRTARPLGTLATVRARTGDYGVAEEIYRRILSIQESELGSEDLEVAASATGLANVLQDQGKYDESKASYERALSIREKRLGPTHPQVALTLNNLAVLLRTTGDFPRAKAAWERALAINEAAFGAEHPEVARNLSNLGNMAREAGDFAGARALLERSLAILEKAFGREHAQVAWTLEVMAQLVLESGDAHEAKRLFRESLAITEKLVGNNPSWRAFKLSGLGYALLETGELEEARRILEQALEARQAAFGADHFFVAYGLNDLATADLRLRDYAAARKHAERAVAITEPAMGPQHPNLAEMLVTLGTAHTGAGDALGAKPLLARAVGIFEQAVGHHHAALAVPLVQLAEASAALGEEAAALEHALRSDSIFREHFRLTGRTLSERQALALAATRPTGLDLAIALAHRPTLVSSRASVWDALVRSRALVLDEVAARPRAGGGESPRAGELANALAAARKRLADVVVRGPGEQEPATYHELTAELRADKERAERALAEQSASFRAEQAQARVGMSEVVGALPEDSALIAFVLYSHLDPARHEPSEGPREGVPSYAAFVVRGARAEPELVSLGPAAEIEALVARWRDTLAQEGLAPGRTRRTEGAHRTVGLDLGERIWAPLEPHVAGARRVFVVPDGALHFVNLGALPVGRDRYLIESGPIVHYLSTERDLVPRETTRVGEGLLAIGAPAFDERGSFAALAPPPEWPESAAGSAGPAETGRAGGYRGSRSACGSFTSMSFESLPAAARETEEIATLWNATDALLAPARRSAARVLTGAAASEAAVKEQAGGNRILHLATHGFFLGGRCASALDDTARQPPAEAPSVIGENPLLLAGLALAGANHRAAAGAIEEDAILTAEEVAALDLDGVEWAVLSACDTGAGELKASEGVFGLRRAFQVAGARTVITSLWAVEDASTRAWMTSLYRNRLTKKLDTAAAVHEASLALLQDRRAKQESTHPFYWAGFVAVGDWR